MTWIYIGIWISFIFWVGRCKEIWACFRFTPKLLDCALWPIGPFQGIVWRHLLRGEQLSRTQLSAGEGPSHRHLGPIKFAIFSGNGSGLYKETSYFTSSHTTGLCFEPIGVSRVSREEHCWGMGNCSLGERPSHRQSLVRDSSVNGQWMLAGECSPAFTKGAKAAILLYQLSNQRVRKRV